MRTNVLMMVVMYMQILFLYDVVYFICVAVVLALLIVNVLKDATENEPSVRVFIAFITIAHHYFL